eukprot:scaffold353294_cov39-Prasinocladus_malaysianus.AAC.1
MPEQVRSRLFSDRMPLAEPFDLFRDVVAVPNLEAGPAEAVREGDGDHQHGDGAVLEGLLDRVLGQRMRVGLAEVVQGGKLPHQPPHVVPFEDRQLVLLAADGQG